jgi:DNA repair protein RadA/Sms
MNKLKTLFACQACGFESSKWLGRCPDCGEWNSFVEERRETAPAERARAGVAGLEMGGKPHPYDLVDGGDTVRIPSGMGEFDRVLGGGVVPGSMVLIGGEPGIGKSTLLLQVAYLMSRTARSRSVRSSCAASGSGSPARGSS